MSIKKSVRNQSKLLLPITSVSVAMAAVCASISTLPSFAVDSGSITAVSDKTLMEMCATSAFRKKNEKQCEVLELSVAPTTSKRAGVPPLSIPSTSPNYGKRQKD